MERDQGIFEMLGQVSAQLLLRPRLINPHSVFVVLGRAILGPTALIEFAATGATGWAMLRLIADSVAQLRIRLPTRLQSSNSEIRGPLLPMRTDHPLMVPTRSVTRARAPFGQIRLAQILWGHATET